MRRCMQAEITCESRCEGLLLHIPLGEVSNCACAQRWQHGQKSHQFWTLTGLMTHNVLMQCISDILNSLNAGHALSQGSAAGQRTPFKCPDAQEFKQCQVQ